MTQSVTFTTTSGGSGATYNDGTSPPNNLANGGHRTNFIPMITEIVNVADFTVAKADLGITASASAEVNGAVASAGAATATSQALIAVAASVSATASAVAANAVVTGVSVVRHSLRPSLLFDFANSQMADQRLTVTRSTPGWVYDRRGNYVSVPPNQGRIDFDPVTGKCKGLLVEAQATNLFNESNGIHTWTGVDVTFLRNQPNGQTGYLSGGIREGVANSDHYAFRSASVVSGTAYTLSFEARSSGRARIKAQFDSSNGAFVTSSAIFNLSDGTVTNTSCSSAVIKSLPDGWYECRCTESAVANVTGFFSLLLDNGSATTYTGDGISGVSIRNLQLVAGAAGIGHIPSEDTFTSRTSTATFTDFAGLLRTAAANVARLTYNVNDLTVAPRQLFEPAATNLITFSEQFENAAHLTPLNLTLTVNTTTSPDGLTTADQVLESTTNGLHAQDLAPVSFVSGTSYTFSLMCKSIGGRNVQLTMPATIFTARSAIFDLISGNVLSKDSGIAATIQKMSNGFFRCSVTAPCVVSGGSRSTYFVVNGSSTSYLGDLTKGLNLWGAQVEATPYPTSYIQTVASTVTRAADVYSSAAATRAADVVTMPVGNWYNPFQGTLYFSGDITALGSTGFPGLFALDDGTPNNVISMFVSDAGADTLTYFGHANGIEQWNITGAAYTAGTKLKTASSYNINDIKFSVNGAAQTTDTIAAIPSVTTLRIGTGLPGITPINGHIEKFAYYPDTLSQAELTGIST